MSEVKDYGEPCWIVNDLNYGQKRKWDGTFVYFDEVQANTEASVRRVLAIKMRAKYVDEPPKKMVLMNPDAVRGLVEAVRGFRTTLKDIVENPLQNEYPHATLAGHLDLLESALAALEGREG